MIILFVQIWIRPYDIFVRRGEKVCICKNADILFPKSQKDWVRKSQIHIVHATFAEGPQI